MDRASQQLASKLHAATSRVVANDLYLVEATRLIRPTLQGEVDRAVGVLASGHDHALAADAGPQHRFTIPAQGELYDQLHVQAELGKDLHSLEMKVWKGTIDSVLAGMGLGFDVRNRLMDGALAQRGKLITAISENHRALVMRILDDIWREGLGIREAAKALEKRGAIATKARATMIARTEIISTANGASLAAARHHEAFKWKQWYAAPGARHPRHYPDVSVDGQTVRLHEAFNIHGWPMDYPGDPNGPAEDVINCRCTLLYVDGPAK